MLIYLAYVILRGSMDDEQKRARISAVYNIFAFVLLLVFIGILPRMTDSLHPGNGGNPGFNNYDLDNNMKLVFYPAVFGWILFGLWLSNIRIRMANLKEKLINK
jgi:heme exporter protein C